MFCAFFFKALYIVPTSKRFEHSGMDITTYQPIDIQTLTMQAFAPLHAEIGPDLTEKQREFVETIFVGLSNSAAAGSCSPTELAQVAMTVMLQVGHSLGGQTYYVTKVENLRLARKNRDIHEKFNGRNHAQLATAHGISEMRVRQILQKERRRNFGVSKGQ